MVGVRLVFHTPTERERDGYGTQRLAFDVVARNMRQRRSQRLGTMWSTIVLLPRRRLPLSVYLTPATTPRGQHTGMISPTTNALKFGSDAPSRVGACPRGENLKGDALGLLEDFAAVGISQRGGPNG